MTSMNNCATEWSSKVKKHRKRMLNFPTASSIYFIIDVYHTTCTIFIFVEQIVKKKRKREKGNHRLRRMQCQTMHVTIFSKIPLTFLSSRPFTWEETSKPPPDNVWSQCEKGTILAASTPVSNTPTSLDFFTPYESRWKQPLLGTGFTP